MTGRYENQRKHEINEKKKSMKSDQVALNHRQS